MSQPLRKKNFAPGSLRGPRSPHTLLLRMAADQERADRIRQLKADHPEIRWRMVAEHVGVTERAAQEWQKTGGIEPTNARKLAELYDVSYEWLWFGREFASDDGRATPDLMGSVDRVDGHIERMADEFRGYVNELKGMLRKAQEERADAQAARERIEALLATQQHILEDMRRVAAGFPGDETLRMWNEGARLLAEAAEARQAARAASEAAQGEARSRRASGR